MIRVEYMNETAFADLRKALEEALVFECGGKGDLLATRINLVEPHKNLKNKASQLDRSREAGHSKNRS